MDIASGMLHQRFGCREGQELGYAHSYWSLQPVVDMPFSLQSLGIALHDHFVCVARKTEHLASTGAIALVQFHAHSLMHSFTDILNKL